MACAASIADTLTPTTPPPGRGGRLLKLARLALAARQEEWKRFAKAVFSTVGI